LISESISSIKSARVEMNDKMIKMNKLWAVSMALVTALVTSGAHAQTLLGVRFGPNGDETRVVIDIQGAPAYALSGDVAGNGRFIVDFEKLSLKEGSQAAISGKGHIERYGFLAKPDGTTQATFDFKKTAKIKEAFLIEPQGAVKKHRLVIDLVTASKSAFLESLPTRYADLGRFIEQAVAEPPSQTVVASTPPATQSTPPAPTKKPVDITKPRNKSGKRVIVIDPGHGGRDPGAIGQSGTLEKHVALSAAFELKKALEKRGSYKIVLTREEDVKIKLEDREALARNAHADLFISLHADAIHSRDIRGASVYTLSEPGTKRSAKIAKSQGNYTVYDLDVKEYGEEVGDMLFDLAQGATRTSSSLFATTLLEHLSGKTPLLNRSHRTGDLRVLLAPDVPAVLLEMAFISNAKDEANLNSKAWRKRVMQATADSIDEYFLKYGAQRFAANAAGSAK